MKPKLYTTAGQVEIVHPRDIIPLISREKVYQVVQQCNAPQNSGSQFAGYGTPTTKQVPGAQVYSRSVVQVQHYSDEEYFMLNSLVAQLYETRVLNVEPSSFEEAIEDACVECLNNFGEPTHAAVFAPNVVVVGQFDSDVIKFKEVGPNFGALLVYVPNKFTIVHSPKPCPYFNVESKYGQFVSNVLIMDTFARLGLK